MSEITPGLLIEYFMGWVEISYAMFRGRWVVAQDVGSAGINIDRLYMKGKNLKLIWKASRRKSLLFSRLKTPPIARNRAMGSGPVCQR